MDDLISRQAAIDAINSHFGFNTEEEYGSAVQEVINGLPAAQPERKTGRWSGPFCSVCGVSQYNYVRILHTDDGPCGTWRYCPHCGAKMEVDNG